MLNTCWALIPIENFVLGDLSDYYSKEKQDPLNSVFTALEKTRQSSGRKELLQSKEKLSYYRGLIEEGGNLINYCPRAGKVEYATRYDRDQAVRSIFAHLQYRGLDYTIRALGKYAQYLNFTKQEYRNLVNNMVGSSCSQNISIISLSQLKKNMMARFDDNSYALPSIKGSPLFPQKLTQTVAMDVTKKREMQQTLKLFRAFCSWGGLSDRPRLLTPILKHPVAMAYLSLDMAGKAFSWNEDSNVVTKVSREDQSAVGCQNLICRRVERAEFNRRMPRMVGSLNLANDLKRLYCEDFKVSQMTIHDDESKQVAEVMSEISSHNEGPLLATHFLSLVTGVPDFLIRTKKWDQVKEIAEASVIRTWDEWAMQETENFSRDLYYEEPLTLELVDRDLYFVPGQKELEVQIDVNLGEFDRVNQKIGKLSVQFQVEVSKPFLNWAQEQWSISSGDILKRRENVQKRFEKFIKDDVASAREDFIIPPWSGNLERLIAAELLSQLENSPVNLFSSLEREVIALPVKLHFAPFALKYQHYRAQVERNKRLAKEREYNRELRQEQQQLSEQLESEESSESWVKAPQK
jgi:hypothetical protein